VLHDRPPPLKEIRSAAGGLHPILVRFATR